MLSKALSFLVFRTAWGAFLFNMPVRFLRPGLTTSEKWNALDWMAQSFYVRLITLVDDYGRYEGNPQLLKSHAFPLSEDVKVQTIVSMCKQLSEHGLAVFYKTQLGKIFLQLTNWQEKPRSEPRYQALTEDCEQLFAIASKCSPSSPSPSPSPSPSFIAPVSKEIFEYGKAIQLNEQDCEAFKDHHEARGWVPAGSRSKMKDWKAALRTWKRNKEKFGAKVNGFHQKPSSHKIPTADDHLNALGVKGVA
jgi:hypothetical protein